MPPAPPTRARYTLLALLSVGIGLGLPLLAAEFVLRLLPVNSGLETQPVNAGQPIMHFRPNRGFVYSSGATFSIVNRGRVNNAGFVSAQDYSPNAPGPLLAVIGDSYVEALMVPYDSTVQGRLARAAAPHARVYSFGASGAALSQYLAVTRFARDVYRPQALVLVLVGNDFDESLLRYKATPGFHYFREEDDSLVLTRVDYHPGLLRRLLRRSALARYLQHNVKVGSLLTRLTRRRDLAEPAVAQASPLTDSTRLALSRAAVDRVLAELPSAAGLPAGRIALLLDGIRPNLYTASDRDVARMSFVGLMRQYVATAGTRAGFAVIDLEPRLIARHERDGTRFEFDTDAHWNAAGHAEAAHAIAEWPVFGQLGAAPRIRTP